MVSTIFTPTILIRQVKVLQSVSHVVVFYMQATVISTGVQNATYDKSACMRVSMYKLPSPG